jgi:hypothetical protein
MKKMLYVLAVISSLLLLAACNNSQNQNTNEYITAYVSLPVAMSIDSSDGLVQIPFETEADEESINWTSSDESIASVDQDGFISIHKAGQVTVTAQSGEYTSSTHLITTLDKYTNYTRIKTKAEFLMIFSNPANFNSTDKLYVLTSDIDFGGDHIEPIGGWDTSDEESPIDLEKAFRATLDGRGYALKNFTISNSASTKVEQSYFGVSLIPYIYDGKVLNLNIVDAVFSGTGFTGSIAGKITNGLIENCFIRATITATANNNGIPSGGIAGIIGADAIVRNIFLDVKVNGGFIYSGFNFGTGTNSNAVSKTLDDSQRRNPIRNTAITTNKGNEDEDAALKDFFDSSRIEDENLANMDNYSFTESAKQQFWAIKEGYMPFLIRQDGVTPIWAIIEGE